MRDDSSESDPKAIWQNQPTEPSAMTLEKIRQKAQDLHGRTRRQLLRNLVVPLVVVLICSYGIKEFPAQRALFAVAIAWGLVGLYFFNRGMWSATMPGDAGLSTGLEFYRQEIGRCRALFRRDLLWSFGPVLLAIGATTLALVKIGVTERRMIPDGMPFIAVLVIWLVAYFVIRMRQQQDLQREIDELNRMEGETGG
jgi:hypothetical protein